MTMDTVPFKFPDESEDVMKDIESKEDESSDEVVIEVVDGPNRGVNTSTDAQGRYRFASSFSRCSSSRARSTGSPPSSTSRSRPRCWSADIPDTPGTRPRTGSPAIRAARRG